MYTNRSFAYAYTQTQTPPLSLSHPHIHTLFKSRRMGWARRHIETEPWHMHTHKHTLSHSLSLTHTLFHSLSLSLSLSHLESQGGWDQREGISKKDLRTCTHTNTLSPSLSLSHTLFLSLSLSLTHTHTHTLRVKEDGISEKRCQGRPFLVAKDETPFFIKRIPMGCLRLVGFFKLYVSFAEYHLFYRSLFDCRQRWDTLLHLAYTYGVCVATISRLLKIIGPFCKRAL